MYHDPTKNEFKNKYGSVTLEPVGEVRSIKGVRWDMVPEECHVSDEDAARVVLITENLHVQPSFETPIRKGGRWYFMVHVSYSEVMLVKIVDLVYSGPCDGHAEICRVNSLQAQMEMGVMI